MSLSLHPEFLQQSKNGLYLLAISGGRDSVALLHTLLDAGYQNLILCHLNHALRGRASGQDASFVRRLAKRHGLGSSIERVDLRTEIDRTGDSMELAARRARHAFFFRCSLQWDCKRILLAHHADDQAETILFNLLRGSAGLKGMQFSSEHHMDGRVVSMLRPLLETRRTEIDDYIRGRQILFREDASNAEAVACRNRLRNEAMPLLQEIMGRDITRAICRAAEISQATAQVLKQHIAEGEFEDPQGRIYLPALIKLSPVLQRMVMHAYLKKHSVSELSEKLITQSLDLLVLQNSAKINLPGGIFLRRKQKRIFIEGV